MIFIFNRKELEVTTSMKRQSEIRDILSQNQIDYKVKVINLNAPSFFSQKGRNTATNTSYEYIFYVHKMDYDKANYVIHK